MFKTLKVDDVCWSWFDEETTLFMLLLPPGLCKERTVLRFGWEVWV